MNSNLSINSITDTLLSKIKYILALYVILQFIFVLFLPTEYRNDAQYYFSLAQDCVQKNEFYPAASHLFEDYIVAPLYINILIVLLKIYNSAVSIGIFNIIINLLQLFLIYKITQFYSDNKTAKLSVLIYIFYLNTFGLVLQNYTELIFTFFILASIYFYLKKTTYFLFISGIMLGASIAIRPVGWVLALCYFVIAIYNYIKRKKINVDYLKLFTGTLLFILLFGSFNYLHFGRFIFTSTTGPVNLLLGANDSATGGFNASVYEKGNIGFIKQPDTLTYIQKGDFYYNQATNWIKQNPLKWLFLAPLKLVHTFAYDDIAISSILNLGDWNFYTIVKHLGTDKSFKNILPNEPLYIKIIYYFLQITQLVYYYFLMIILFLWIIKIFKERKFSQYSFLHSLFALVGTIMILVTVGTPRYKYPLLIVMIPFIASYIELKYLNKINREKQ